MSNPSLSPAAVLEAVIADALDGEQAYEGFAEFSGDDDLRPDSIRTFEDAGVLTTDRGLVLRLSNGQEFQITIVQSR